MADFVLSCCSTADLTKEHFQQRDISYICFHYALDGVDYPDDLGETMPFDKFYAAMANGAETRTSQVNISEFVDYFTPFLEQGKDILHVCLSSGLSGVSNSAENAARIVRERYPDRKIYIVDSLGASSGYGLLMDRLADLRDEGMSIDAVRDWADVQAASGFSVRSPLVSAVKTKPGISRWAEILAPSVLRNSCWSASVKTFTQALETL